MSRRRRLLGGGLGVGQGLQLWLDASDTSTITESSGSVSQWNDKSGYGNNATEGVGARQPTTGTRTLGGRNILDFDGTDDSLIVAPSDSINNLFATGGTMLFVGVPDSDGGGNFGRIIDKTPNGLNVFVQNEVTTTLQPRMTVPFSTTSGDWKTTANSVDLDVGNIIAMTYDGSATTNNPAFTINGEAEAETETSAPVGTIKDDSANSLYIGNNSFFNRGFDGGFAELLIYDRVLSAAEITLVNNYLTNKWGI